MKTILWEPFYENSLISTLLWKPFNQYPFMETFLYEYPVMSNEYPFIV